jgi:alpha-glucosidase
VTESWWKSAVVYQVYPRSFADSGGDGVGDLEGIRRHLDHLVWLGVDALWISPFFVSPMKDFGYDVADYCDVDPLFGTLADFDRLLADAHARGLRVLVDWVPNHTSDQHPWFLESRASRDAPKRDWYVWRDGTPDRPPNNWRAAFGGGSPAWTWDDATRQWYLHLFLPEQPDLDWSNPRVVDAMHDTLRFWLDRGVDGFRMDVIHAIGKDPALPDLPRDRAIIPMAAQHDDPRTHAHVRALRRLIDAYPGERVMVGEVYLFSIEQIARYYGAGDGLHLAFNFMPLYTPWDAAQWRARIVDALDALAPRAAWPTWVLSNHDNPRHHTRYGNEARARAAAVLLLTLPGTPFLYAGEELGLEDAIVPEHVRVDPGNRDGCRAPIPWDAEPGHGWGAAAEPWLPFPPDAATRNVASMRRDPASILHLYRRLLAARRASTALRGGDWAPLATPDGVLAFQRTYGAASPAGDARVVLVNFTDTTVPVPLTGAWRVEVASDGDGEGGPYAGRLTAEQAVVLRPVLGPGAGPARG